MPAMDLSCLRDDSRGRRLSAQYQTFKARLVFGSSVPILLQKAVEGGGAA